MKITYFLLSRYARISYSSNFFKMYFWLFCLYFTSVVHPDPAGLDFFCKQGSGSIINSGSDSGSGFKPGSKLSSVSTNKYKAVKMYRCIFHKQAGSRFESGSEIKVKVGSGSEKNNNQFSDPQHCI